MLSSERTEHVGPEPIPEELYISRQLPVRRALVWVGRMLVATVIVSVLLAVFFLSLYRLPASEPFLRVASRIMPIPALRVNGTAVLYRDYVTMLDGWQELSRQQGATDAVSHAFVDERVQDRLIQQVLVGELMEEVAVTVTPEQQEEVRETFLGQYGSEADYEQALYERFRWTEEEFSELIVTPLAQLHALDRAVLADASLQDQSRSIALDVHQDVTAHPEAFLELAMGAHQVSMQEDAGYLAVADYPAEVRAALMETENGVLTPVIELEHAFVFYKVLDREQRAGVWFVSAQVVTVPKRDVYDLLEERSAEARIQSYLPE